MLRSPFEETVARDIVAGKWEEPTGAAGETLGEGLWALPGLVDAHAHLASAQLFEAGSFAEAVPRARHALEAGVTMILDKGWNDDTTIRVIDAIPEDKRPEIEAAARIIAPPDGYFPGFAPGIEPDDLRDEVAAQAVAGRGWVKVIGDWPRRGRGPVANFDEAELRAAVEVAHAADVMVAIHTMAREVPAAAVSAGVDSIEHGLFLDEDDLGVLGGRGGMWVPTILRVEATIAQIGVASSGGRLLAEGLGALSRLLPVAIEAGVHVLAGTDLVGAPADVAAEARRLGEFGMTPAQVVTAVSTSGFVATGRDATFTPGTPANAVFFEANPILELGALSHPRHVIRLGRVV